MKFKISIGGQSYYKTEKEVFDFAKELPSINRAVVQVVNSLIEMNKNDRLGSGDKIDTLECIVDGMMINVRME